MTSQAINSGAPPGEMEYRSRHLSPLVARCIFAIAVTWTLFQMWIASPLPFMIGWGVLIDVPKRGIHLAFALLLCFLLFPATRPKKNKNTLPWYDILLGLGAASCALYLPLAYRGLVDRQGVLLEVPLFGMSVPVEFMIGAAGVGGDFLFLSLQYPSVTRDRIMLRMNSIHEQNFIILAHFLLQAAILVEEF